MTPLHVADNARFSARGRSAGTETSESGHIGAVVHVSPSQRYARVAIRPEFPSPTARACREQHVRLAPMGVYRGRGGLRLVPA